MKKEILALIKEEHDIRALRIEVPVEFGDEDIPFDFPGRKDDEWSVTIDVEKGQILGYTWPETFSMSMKVTDGGTYHLINDKGERVLSFEHEYVPWGDDYIECSISPNGVIEGGVKGWVDNMIRKSNDNLSDLIGDELD